MEHVSQFFGRSLRPNESKYSVREKEAQSINGVTLLSLRDLDTDLGKQSTHMSWKSMWLSIT